MAAFRALLLTVLSLLGLINIFVSAAPTDLSPNNTGSDYVKLTNSHELLRRTQCDTGPGPTVGDARKCHCYGGRGIDRAPMIDAISNACAKFVADGVWGPNADEKTFDTWYQWYYPYANGEWNPDNVILVKLIWRGLGAGGIVWTGPGLHCDPQTLDFNTCFNAFHSPIDSCDTSSENDKHGGWSNDLCFEYTVDPNPKSNNNQLPVPAPGVNG